MDPETRATLLTTMFFVILFAMMIWGWTQR